MFLLLLVLIFIDLYSLFLFSLIIFALCDSMINLFFQLKFSDIDLDQALFQPFPSEIIFQNYTPCEVYEVPLVLRNNDKVSMFDAMAVSFMDT